MEQIAIDGNVIDIAYRQYNSKNILQHLLFWFWYAWWSRKNAINIVQVQAIILRFILLRKYYTYLFVSLLSHFWHSFFSTTPLELIPNIYTDQWEPIVIYHSITFTGPYTTMQPTLTSWHLDSNYCRTRCRLQQLRFVLSPLLFHPRLLGTFQSDIPLFTLTWPAKHSPNQGWESTHRLHLYPLGGVFYSP